MTRTHRFLLASALAALLGCGSAEPEPNPAGQAYAFPHPEGFDAGAAHGQPWIDSPEGCVQCHRSPERVTLVKSCRGCHPPYPHPEGFGDPAAHGGDGSDGGFRCAECHGTGEARPAGQEDSACRDCHQDYPHRVTFREPGIHGPEALDDLAGCARCHGADWQGSTFADACFDCHELYPHEPGRLANDTGLVLDSWALPRAHGQSARSEGNAACGGSCHGQDFEGGLSEVACRDCHAPYPHSDQIRVEHRDLVHALGEDSCLGCHGEGAGFAAEFGCTDACHRSSP
jgi:hypothetical protein